MHAGDRRGQQDEAERDHDQRHKRAQLAPGGARHEQQREGDHHVDEPGAEIGLGDHQHRRHERAEHHAHGRLALAQPAHAVHHVGGQRDHEQHLAQLGGLEGEEGKADGPLGPVRRVADREHGEDAQQQQRIEPVFEMAQARVVHAREHHHADEARDQVRGLAVDVVARRAGDQVLGRGVQRHEGARCQPEHGERQQGVQRRAPGRAALLDALGRLDRARGPQPRGDARARRCAEAGSLHQKVFEAPATKRLGLPNHCEASSRAIGAAVSAPNPPCSTVTAITIGRAGSAT